MGTYIEQTVDLLQDNKNSLVGKLLLVLSGCYITEPMWPIENEEKTICSHRLHETRVLCLTTYLRSG